MYDFKPMCQYIAWNKIKSSKQESACKWLEEQLSAFQEELNREKPEWSEFKKSIYIKHAAWGLQKKLKKLFCDDRPSFKVEIFD